MSVARLKRAEIRRHLKIAQQLKVGTLVLVAVLLLAAYPIYEFTKAATNDPIFGELDSLALPAWAAVQHEDAFGGSRWCIGQCRVRKRTWVSDRNPEETNAVYEAALRKAGWRPRTDGICPSVSDGFASCWKRDEYVLDMWVRAPICNLPPPRPTPTPTVTATAQPTATTAPPDGAAPDPQPTACPGAFVTVEVFNAIGYQPEG